MSVEAFHRKVKSVYLAKKQNRRLDKLLYILLKIARDIIFDGLRKHEIGKRTHRKCDVNKRCIEAKKMKEREIKASLVEENCWSVMSASHGGRLYDVALCMDTCDCLVKCDNCKVCVHMYSCSCVDYAVHFVACKHAHLVHIQVTEEDDKELPDLLFDLYKENNNTAAVEAESPVRDSLTRPNTLKDYEHQSTVAISSPLEEHEHSTLPVNEDTTIYYTRAALTFSLII